MVEIPYTLSPKALQNPTSILIGTPITSPKRYTPNLSPYGLQELATYDQLPEFATQLAGTLELQIRAHVP